MKEQDKLNSLLQRVPFSSLPLIICLLVICGLTVAGIVLLVANRSVEGLLRELIPHATVMFGCFTFAFWNLLSRRKTHLEKLKEMLSRTPIQEWKYQEDNWSNWLDYTERIAFGKTLATRPPFIICMILLIASVAGFTLSLGRPESSFLAAFLLFVGLLLFIAIVYYLHWQKQVMDWKKSPSEAKIPIR